MGLFKAEQVYDDGNKYCVKSFNNTNDEAKVLAHQIVSTGLRQCIAKNSIAVVHSRSP